MGVPRVRGRRVPRQHHGAAEGTQGEGREPSGAATGRQPLRAGSSPGERRTLGPGLLKPSPAPSRGIRALLPVSGGLGPDRRAVRGHRMPRPLPSDRPSQSHHFRPLRTASPAEAQPRPPCTAPGRGPSARPPPSFRRGVGQDPPGASSCLAAALRPRLT